MACPEFEELCNVPMFPMHERQLGAYDMQHGLAALTR